MTNETQNKVTTLSEPKEKTREQLMSLCHQLAEVFKTRASKYDDEGSFPVENFADLKATGLLGMMVPKEYGGWGCNFLTYSKALEILATGDASTSLAFNMHNITVGSLAEIPEAPADDRRSGAINNFREWIFEQAVKEKKLFASAASEPGIGAHFSKLKSSYRRTENGFILNGTKSFVSMAGYADYYVVAAKAEHSKSATAAVSFLIVDRNAPGSSMDNIWNVMGMRSTSTNPVHFEECFIPQERLYMASEGMALYKIAREPHWLAGGYSGVYLGIMTATFDFLVEFLKKKKTPGTDISLSQDPLVQHQLGKLYTELTSARLAVYHAAHLVDTARGSDEANAAIHHAKYLVSESGPKLASDAIRMCGASSISKFFPLERYYRDSRCGALQPAYSDDCLLYLGKTAFGANLKNPIETYW
ncbi:MAG TPA: acyl-CoA dehydrogenase [Aeromonadales bacterium]|nr:acyl-CoA dehydrogenase [Aeromonadales bacterium]